MKTITSIVILIFLGIRANLDLYSQEISTPIKVGNQAKKIWEIKVPRLSVKQKELRYAVLKDGVAVLSHDDKTLLCYDYKNQLIWQAPTMANKGRIDGLASSSDGQYLLLSYIVGYEGPFMSAIHNANGKLLWKATYNSPLVICPSGGYLISFHSSLDWMPPIVLNITNGTILWEDDADLWWWHAAVSRNDKLAYYNRGKLKLFDLKNGQLLWEKPVKFSSPLDNGKVHISEMGNVISYNNYMADYSDRRITYVFDSKGDALWQRTTTMVAGKTNGGIPTAISQKGELIAIDDIGKFAIYSTKIHKEILTLPGDDYHSIFEFTKEFLACRPQKQLIRLITFMENGTNVKDYILDGFMNIEYEDDLYFGSDQESSDITFRVLQKTNAHFILSQFSLKLNP
jgi:hypothetical protein